MQLFNSCILKSCKFSICVTYYSIIFQVVHSWQHNSQQHALVSIWIIRTFRYFHSEISTSSSQPNRHFSIHACSYIGISIRIQYSFEAIMHLVNTNLSKSFIIFKQMHIQIHLRYLPIMQIFMQDNIQIATISDHFKCKAYYGITVILKKNI